MPEVKITPKKHLIPLKKIRKLKKKKVKINIDFPPRFYLNIILPYSYMFEDKKR